MKAFLTMRDGTATKLKIEECALNLFVKKGVMGTTIKDIAQAASVAEGTMYRHYKSKEDLATELYMRAYNALSLMLQESLKQGSFKDQLRHLIQVVCRAYDEDPINFNYLLIAQHHELPRIKSEKHNVFHFLVRFLQSGISSKEVQVKNAEVYATVMMGILIQSAAARIYGRISETMTEQHELLTHVIFKALELK